MDRPLVRHVIVQQRMPDAVERKGGIIQTLMDHFAKVYKMSASLSLAA